jgi:sigma-E factor negative regulatory protein RseB
MNCRWLIAGIAFAAIPAWAIEPTDGVALLNKAAGAAQKLVYSGTFVYQSGGKSETSRIVHLLDAGREYERLEVLDGSPREVVRRDNEIRCYLPDRKLVIVEKRGQERAFPALLPVGLGGIPENYSIRITASERVAGFDALSAVLEPKDGLRYGHQFWIEAGSGLLLKSVLLGEKGEILESFAFTQLQIGGDKGGEKGRELVRSRFEGQSDWRVHDHQIAEPRQDDLPWVFRTQLPGFRKTVGMRRLASGDLPESTHMVFSDGLAAVSVFIESLAGRKEKPEPGMTSMGTVHVYQRILGDHVIVVMGEVPAATVKKLGDSIEAKRK